MRLLALCLLFLSGCAEGTSGALGQTQATPNCSPSDFVCAVSGLDGPIAVSASLPIHIAVTSQGSASPPLDFRSANTDIFTLNESRISGVGPGVASLLVMTEGNIVVDFFHVWVVSADKIGLHRRNEEGMDLDLAPTHIELLVGDELRLSAEPYEGSQRLLGELDATWSADETILKLLDEGVKGRRRIVAVAPGTTTIQVDALTLSTSLEVEVVQ